jgi:cytochrome c
MKKILSTFIASAALAAVSPSVLAEAALAQAKNCMTCHAIDRKLLGPSFKDVAAKYTGQKDAAAKLQTKVMKGGGGNWGGFMPANPQVSETEAKILVTWVLSQK